MIYSVLSQFDFISAFLRSERKDQFSRAALEVLFEHYNSDFFENGYSLDIIEICCTWSEYSSGIDLWADLGADEFSEDGLTELLDELPYYLSIPGGGYLVHNT